VLQRPIEGVLIVGTQPKCGKTVITAGLAAAMIEGGFQVQAIKPLEFLPGISLMRGHDQIYLDKITRAMQHTDTIHAASCHDVSNIDWNRVTDVSRKTAFPVLLECPGTVAAPLRFTGDLVLDVVDFAKALGISILLVTPKSDQLVGQMAAALAYLNERQADIMGWVGVETSTTKAPYWETESLYLSHQYRLHCLGVLPYSPSISVEGLQQGNLIRLTEMSIDLLPLQQALKLMV
jgi:dethiobiotin synthetase